MTVTHLLCLLFAIAAAVLLMLCLLQRRELKAYARLSKEVQDASIAGIVRRKLDVKTDQPDLAAIVMAINNLVVRVPRVSERQHPAVTGKFEVLSMDSPPLGVATDSDDVAVEDSAQPLRRQTDGKIAATFALPANPDLFATLGDRLHEVVMIHVDTIKYVNPQFARLMGVDRNQVVGRKLPDLVPPDQHDLVDANLGRVLEGEDLPGRFEIDLIGMQGQLTRLEVAATRTEYAGGPALLITGVEVIPTQTFPALVLPGSADVPRSRARQVLDSLGESLLTVNSSGSIEFANPAAAALLGVPQQELLGKSLEQIMRVVDEADRKLLRDPVDQALKGRSTIGIGRRAVLLTLAAGAERSIELSTSPLRSRDNATDEIIGAVVVLHDVTELRGLTRQMSYQATHDALTGLVNRREFERRLGETLESARHGDQTHVLCYVDLDHFKDVNDQSGHQGGDALLREVAKIMRKAVRDSDYVGRLGGDEFAMLLTGCPLKKGRQIADDLTRAIAENRFIWKDRVHQIGASVGLVEVTRDSSSIEDVLAAADSACYVAKKHSVSGTGGVAVYSARDEAVARQSREIHWLKTLQMALRNNSFRLYQQPIVPAHGLNGGDGPSMEVLVRLADERGEELPVVELVRAAERYRLIGLLDRWVVQNTLTALGRGSINLTANHCLAINISGQTLEDTQFMEFVVDCLDQTGVDPRQVCFEISEAAVASNLEAARRFVGVLHGMGCRFALDDFGSSLGSFASLKNLPMDYLKIDGAFMRNLARDGVNQAMVTATIKLARSLNFKVIAEQVEDAAGVETARSMGVDYVQGYAIGRPSPLKIAA